MKQMKTQILNLKKLKNQVAIGSLTLNIILCGRECERKRKRGSYE